MSWIQCFVRKRFDKALDVQGGLWIMCGGFPSHSMFVPLLCLSKGGSYLIWGGLFLVFPREKSPISCIGSSQTDVPSIKTSRRYIGSHINQSTRSSSEKSQSQTKAFFLHFLNLLTLKSECKVHPISDISNQQGISRAYDWSGASSYPTIPGISKWEIN